MKNIKKLLAVIIAVMMLASVIASSTISASAANAAFDGKKVYVLSHFDENKYNDGLGVIDEFGKPMTTVPDDADLKAALPEHALMEYCGTDYVEWVKDNNATNGSAAKIYVGDNYASYDKTKICIRKIAKDQKILIKEDADIKSKTSVSFYFYVHNLAAIDTRESGIEICEIQDTKEYYIPLQGINNYLKSNGSKLEEDKWMKIEIPFSAISSRQPAEGGDITIDLVRIYINNMKKKGQKFNDSNRPYFMIDELCIVEHDKALSGDAGFDKVETPSSSAPAPSSSKKPTGNTSGNEVQLGIGGNKSSSTVSRNSVPAQTNSLQLKPTSSEQTSTVESVESTANTSSAPAEEEGSNTMLWIIIAVAAVVVLGGGAAVLLLVLKKKPAPVAPEATETDTPSDSE